MEGHTKERTTISKWNKREEEDDDGYKMDGADGEEENLLPFERISLRLSVSESLPAAAQHCSNKIELTPRHFACCAFSPEPERRARDRYAMQSLLLIIFERLEHPISSLHQF